MEKNYSKVQVHTGSLAFGAGYRLCGQRKVDDEEFNLVKNKLKGNKDNIYVGTFAPTIFWMPLFPVETEFYVGKVGSSRFFGSILFTKNHYPYQSDKRFFYKVYWEHVKSKKIFLALPSLILISSIIGLFFDIKYFLIILIIGFGIYLLLSIMTFLSEIKKIIKFKRGSK